MLHHALCTMQGRSHLVTVTVDGVVIAKRVAPDLLRLDPVLVDAPVVAEWQLTNLVLWDLCHYRRCCQH